MCIKKELPFGSIVAINGSNFDSGRWPRKDNTPIFYGLVLEPTKVVQEVKETTDSKGRRTKKEEIRIWIEIKTD